MRKFIVTIISLLTLSQASASHTSHAVDLSIGIKGGYIPSASPVNISPSSAYTSTSTKDSAAVGINLGAEFHENFSTELEVVHHFKRDINLNSDTIKAKTDVAYTTGMVNLYLKFPTQYSSWYIGGGLGMNYSKLGDVSNTANNVNLYNGSSAYKFAWQVMLGTTISYSRLIDFELELRYLNAGKSKISTNLEIESNEFLVLGGFKYYF